jgi:hypothetical protein
MPKIPLDAMSAPPRPPNSEVVRVSASQRGAVPPTSEASSTKSRPEFRHSLLPGGRLQHGLVDDKAWLTSVLNVEYGADVGGAVAREALIGLTKRVGR